jgi:hypothetical protein
MGQLKSTDAPKSINGGPNHTESKVFGTQDYTRLFENDFTFQNRGFARPVELRGYRSPRPFDSDDESPSKVPSGEKTTSTPKESSSMVTNTPNSSNRNRCSSSTSSGKHRRKSPSVEHIPLPTDSIESSKAITNPSDDLPIAQLSEKTSKPAPSPPTSKLTPLDNTTTSKPAASVLMDPNLYKQFVAMVAGQLDLPDSP